ncbi:MAG: iron chelate uptake ABC transporter family permease subunit, partial [Telluria sp.]
MHPFFRSMRHRATLVISALTLAAVASLAFSGMIGSVPVPLAEMPGALLEVINGSNGSLAATLLELRLSRALVAFVTGAALALAGVMMQALLRNPVFIRAILKSR